MRIADVTITRNYLSSLSKNTEQYYALSEKVSSGCSYQKASEDPASAIKAMKVRSTLSKIDTYQDNIDEVNAILTERESVISEISDILTEAQTDILQGKNGTYDDTDRESIATSLQGYQGTILSLVNSQYCDKYIFGGDDMYEIPFSTDTSGNLLYHGVDVDTGTFGTEEFYCDIGLGLSGDTAYNISSPGSELLGTGVDGDGITNNIYNLLGDIAEMFENNDLTNLDAFSEKLGELSENILVKYTSIGEESAFIKMASGRLTTSEANATARQKELEGVETAEAILEYSQQELSYEAALQIGASMLQQTLLDYLG